MADQIQFHCPVCGTTLRLPLEMAASQGPCPCCQREIVAPDPYRGIGAYEPAPPPAPKPAEPFRPFADSPPLVPKSPSIQTSALPDETVSPVHAEPEITTPEPAPAAPDKHAPAPQWAILVLSVLLTSVVSLVAGYILGVRSNWLVSNTPFPVLAPKLEVPAQPAEPDTKPVLLKIQAPEPEPEPEKKSEPVKASTLAETALRAFLDAPDWTTRSSYVLFPEKVRAAMEAYSRKVPDGPTPFKSISVQNSYTDKKTGNTLFIFEVITEQHPTGIPVAVSETPKGWNVDWQSFVEFRDDLFKAFADGPADQTGRFHLIVSAPPAPRAANTENEHFSSYLLDPPLPGRQRIAYAKKSSEIHATLSASTANGAVFTPVLEITRKTTPDGKSYLEIATIIATDWLPENE